MWLLLLFILIPLLEIWLFILLGGFIGVYPTLLIILLTAILGTFLVKTQGINVLKELQIKEGFYLKLNDYLAFHFAD